jgi:hypothetical protein
MDSKSKSSVCNTVYHQFPELKGVNPTVKELPADKFQLIFHGKALTENGKSMPRTVRVVADENGKVLKLSTSR